MVLVLFEGVIVAGKIAHENSQYLAASDYAFDLAWTKFNESKEALKGRTDTTTTISENISSNAAPVLYYAGSPAVSYVTYERIQRGGGTNGVYITVNVEWGPLGARKRLNSKVPAGVADCLQLHQEVVFYRSLELERGDASLGGD